MIISSSMKKIMTRDDVKVISRGLCLKNQGFQFQLWLDNKCRVEEKIEVMGDLCDHIAVYRVHDIKGMYESPRSCKTDSYYIKSEDDMYPDLVRACDSLTTTADEKCVLLIDVSSKEKTPGEHTIGISVGDEKAQFVLKVADEKLVDTRLILTNWFHIDGICNYYNVEPFSSEFYARFESFLDAYVAMGNNMMLIPAFTAPLDTEVGGERTTTQLVKIKKNGESYEFDFSEMERFIKLCAEKGIRYFEHSHLFTQWGAEFCPKIMVEKDGDLINDFGWEVASTSDKYKAFLSQYLEALQCFVQKLGVEDSFYLHLSDEPRPEHVSRYEELSELVKRSCNLKTMDALSDKEFSSHVNMPVVALYSGELEKFDENKMLYYCVGVDTDHITNRFLHMPLQRTEILGFQLYANRAKGFLHWGYNFYNTFLSKSSVNPYEDTTCGVELPAGDGFVVYPGEHCAELSVRYFSLKRAFEDHRLLETLEKKIGKQAVLEMLEAQGVSGVHKYPRSVEWHEDFRVRIIELIRGE